MFRLSVSALSAHSEVDPDVPIAHDIDARAVIYWDHPLLDKGLERAAGSDLGGRRAGRDVADPPGDGQSAHVYPPGPIDIHIDVDG